jgi:hypothetical protein
VNGGAERNSVQALSAALEARLTEAALKTGGIFPGEINWQPFRADAIMALK